MKHRQRWVMAALVGLALAAALAPIALGDQDSLAADGTIYVDADATGTNNGTSWENAFTTLQPALDGALVGDQIWVAAGTYTPTHRFDPEDPRSATFQLKNGVALYGGFDPTVGDVGWEDRDWVNNITTLSGDIGTQGDLAENSYHVFYHPSELALDGSAVLDGFTVTGGSANLFHNIHSQGGGMYNRYSSPSVTNCTFSGNQAFFGGGMYNDWSSPTVTNCTFSGNSASDSGGGMFNWSSSPAMVGCTFSGNSATQGGGMYNYDSWPGVTNCTFSGNSASDSGGGMFNWSSSPALVNCTFSANSATTGGGMCNDSSSPAATNCTFSANSASQYGGAMYNYSSSPAVTSCTFLGNSAATGGGLYNDSSSPVATNCTFSGNSANGNGGGLYNYSSSAELTNCILWGDSPDEIYNQESEPVVTYSDIQGGWPGDGNIDADPLFVDPGSGDCHLGPGSPCIDAGTNDAPNLPDFDLEGDRRIMDGNGDGTAVVDMGGDEVWGPPLDLIYVDQDAAGYNNGTSWEDALTDLQHALAWAVDGDEIWVAEGIYTPTHESSPGDPRSATFQLKNGVALYGGFDPTVGDVGWEDRDWVGNVTTLSGDIGIAGNLGDNSYHVFYHPSELALDGSAVLDGFTVTGGNANDVPFVGCGGGMYNVDSSPTVINCTFSGNEANGGTGGGMCNYSSSPGVVNCTFSGNSAVSGGGMLNYHSSPAVTNCTFLSNSAGLGGGMSNYSSSPAVTNCTFLGNSVGEGGGMYNRESSPVVTNCTFSGNSANDRGGAMSSSSSSPVVTNCTFSGNSAAWEGGGMWNWEGSTPEVTNCILWGDSPNEITNDESEPVVTYSDIQGGWPGDGNIDADPLVVDPGSGDYHLGSGSPCIDAGTNDAPNLPDYDFEGDPRSRDGNGDGTAVVDMGVDEAFWYALYLPLVLRGY